jgi:hypothetical protein
LNVHNVSDIRQIEIHTAEPLVPGPSHLEVKISIAKLKRYKSPGSDQIPAQLIQADGETLVSVMSGRSLLLYQGTRTVMKLTAVILTSISYNILSDICLSGLSRYVDEITWDHECDFLCKR